MKLNKISHSVFGFLVIAALLVISILEIQKVYAQSDASSSDPIVESVSAADDSDPGSVADESLDPQVAGASTSSDEEIAPATDSASNSSENLASEVTPPLPPAESAQKTPVTPALLVNENGLVEVALQCNQSYTGPLYDSPSGHLEAVTSSSTPLANVIGEQSWTLCRDARGHTHEFTLTPSEYADLRIRGTPARSVMESPADAALDSFFAAQ